MVLIDDAHIFRIQKITGWVMTGLASILLVSNVITFENTLSAYLNLLYASIALIASFVTVLKDKNFIRLLQIVLFLLTGSLTYVAKSWTIYLGDLLLLIGIFYLYIYRFFKIFSLKKLLPFFLAIIIMRLVSNIIKHQDSSSLTIILDTNLNTLFTIVFIVLLIFIFNDEITWYTLQSYKNEQLLRIGMNAHNLIHEQNMGVHTDTIALAVKAIQNKNYEAAIEFLTVMKSMINKSNRMRELLLDNYSRKEGLKESVIELNELLEFLMQFEYLNHSPDFYLQPLPEFIDQDLTVKGNRYEIASLFQIIIDNAVESMKKTGTPKHRLYVNFEKRNQTGIVTLRDTGNSFPQAAKGEAVDLSKIETTKEKHGGFGITYVLFLIKKYKGGLTITNHPETGAIVCVELPLVNPGNALNF